MDRRNFIGALGAGFFAGAAPALFAATTFRGRVLADGRPLAGVVVSDGHNCSATDADGAYRLPPNPEARFLFVTVPTGYAAKEGRHFLPYNSTDGVFRLERLPSDCETARFVQVTDTEIWGVDRKAIGWRDRVRRIADREGAGFVVHTGDICRPAGMRATAQLLNADTMGRPVYYCLGNHDLTKEGPYGEWLFEQLFGPCWYSFDFAHVHFVVVPMPDGDRTPSYSHDRVADWLRNDLALVPKGRKVVMLTHYLTNPGDPDWALSIGAGAAKFKFAESCDLSGVVYGHRHYSSFLRRGRTAVVCAVSTNKGGSGADPAAVRSFEVGEAGLVCRSWYQPEDAFGDVGPAVWSTDLKAPVLLARPIHRRGRVFTATLDDDGRGTAAVMALAVRTGRLLWRGEMGNSVKSSIACAAGRVIAQDIEGCVRAFSEEDGTLVWEHRIRSGRTPPELMFGGGVAADESVRLVYVGVGSAVEALDLADGRVRWRVQPESPKGHVAATLPVAGEGVVVIPSVWDAIRVYDSGSGEKLWQEQMPFCHARPLIEGNRLYCLPAGRVFAEYDLRSGRKLRARELDGSTGEGISSGILHVNGLFVFGDFDGLRALDEKTLETVWKIPVGENRVLLAPYSHWQSTAQHSTAAALDDGDGVFAAADGRLRRFSFSNGKVTEEIACGAPFFTEPVVIGDRVVAVDFAGRASAYDFGVKRVMRR